MSLILGIYSKNEKICIEEIEKVLKDFSLNDRRKLQIKSDRRILFSLAKSEIDCNTIVQNEDKSLVILFGGRLYDFEKSVNYLIKRDHKFKNEKNCAEFILHSYEEHGESFLKEINGIFAFAIYDRLNDELIIGNDSFGLYPLFIYNFRGYIIFSTEYEPITKYKRFDKKLNYDAIAEYFTLGLPLGDKTFFKDINNLHPASLLRIKKGKIDSKQYDDLNIKINKNKDINFFAKEISKVIHKATQVRFGNPKNIKCCLTGGRDTRLILGNLTKSQRESIEFFTRKSAWLADGENPDIIIAKLLAKRFSLKHIICKESPTQARDFGISFFKRRRTRTPRKETITGLGGGEIFGGHCFISPPINIEKVDKNEIQTKLETIFTKNFLKNVSNPYLSLKKELKRIKAENKEFLFNIHQITRGFLTNRYGGSRYEFVKRYDSIFWDKNFIKFLLTVPKRFIIGRKLYNQVYKNHFSHLFEIPIAGRDMIVLDKRLHGVEKLKYDKALKAYIKSHYTYDKKFYNSGYIKSIAKEKNSPLVRFFLHFEAWYRVFVLNK